LPGNKRVAPEQARHSARKKRRVNKGPRERCAGKPEAARHSGPESDGNK
jgi:hypothetical protein